MMWAWAAQILTTGMAIGGQLIDSKPMAWNLWMDLRTTT